MTGKKKKEKKICKYVHGWALYNCNREAQPDDEYCIFHSKNIEGKKDGFNVKFWTEFENEIKDGYMFIGFIFPNDIPFRGKYFKKDAFL